MDRFLIGNVIRIWRNMAYLARAAPDLDPLELIVQKRCRFIKRLQIITSVKFVDADRKPFRSDGKRAILRHTQSLSPEPRSDLKLNRQVDF
jgi:hypothetical protein